MAHRAWVTGGSSGIGASVVEHLRVEDATVCVLDPRPPEADVLWAKVDLTDPGSVEEAVDGLSARAGWPDQLVLCAGTPGVNLPIAEHPLDTWSQVLASNLTGPFLVLRKVIGEMCKRGLGRIVAVASGNAVRPAVDAGAYAASEAGLIALIKSAALEGAVHGVTANVVAPGVSH